MKLLEVTNTTWENLQIATPKSVSFTLLNWFVRCNLQIFSGCVCHLEQLHAQSLFLFPIVCSINLIPFFDIGSVVSYSLSFARVCSPLPCLRGPLRSRCSVWLCHWGLLRQITPSSPNPLSNESVIHDGRKHKTVVFLQSNAVREQARTPYSTHLPLFADGLADGPGELRTQPFNTAVTQKAKIALKEPSVVP